ncbi:hypothetical protein JCM10450v2_006760 [Rhodotorula kratochvilovae]
MRTVASCLLLSALVLAAPSPFAEDSLASTDIDVATGAAIESVAAGLKDEPLAVANKLDALVAAVERAQAPLNAAAVEQILDEILTEEAKDEVDSFDDFLADLVADDKRSKRPPSHGPPQHERRPPPPRHDRPPPPPPPHHDGPPPRGPPPRGPPPRGPPPRGPPPHDGPHHPSPPPPSGRWPGPPPPPPPPSEHGRIPSPPRGRPGPPPPPPFGRRPCPLPHREDEEREEHSHGPHPHRRPDREDVERDFDQSRRGERGGPHVRLTDAPEDEESRGRHRSHGHHRGGDERPHHLRGKAYRHQHHAHDSLSVRHAFAHFAHSTSHLARAVGATPVFFALWTALKLALTAFALVRVVQMYRARREGRVRLEEEEPELPAPVTQEKV